MIIDRKAFTLVVTFWCFSIAAAYWIGSGRHSDSGADSGASAANHNDSRKNREPSISHGGSDDAAGRGLRDRSDHVPRSVSASFLRVLESGDAREMGDQLGEFAESMRLEEVTRTLEAVEALDPGPARQKALFTLLRRWSELEPLAALEYAGNIKAPKDRYEADMLVFSGWAKVDAKSALDHVLAHPDSLRDKNRLNAVFNGLAKSADIPGALAFMASLNAKDTPYGSRIYESARRIFERDDKQAVAWAESLPEGEVRDRAITGILDQWARHDPVAAREWMDRHVSGSITGAAHVELGESWARVDPTAAYEWATDLPAEDKNTSRVMDRIFYRWMQYDFETAADQLVKLEPAPHLDGAFEQYIDRARYINPEDTMPWAESITDPERRRRAIYRVAYSWRSKDKAGLTTYIRNSTLPDKDKQRMLRWVGGS